MNYFVNALAIRRWADQLTARSTLPQVIRRLVSTTVRDISSIDFPANESVQRSGCDGFVTCATGNAWVPAGRSVWELGTTRDVKGKADDDFEKRTAEVSQAEQQEMVYIAVTPRHWEHKSQWVTDNAGKGHWKEIRAYDADDLEQWLENAAPVAVWFGQLIGTRPNDVDDFETKWNALSNIATHPLSPTVFLASRTDEVELVNKWLVNAPSVLRIHTRSPGEGIDFVVAVVRSLEADLQATIIDRAIIVESPTAWKLLRDSQTPAILVVDPSISLSPEELTRAIAKGHHILIAEEPTNITTQGVLSLGNAGQFELSRALEACGYSSIESEQHARASAGSLAILKRRLARYPISFTPPWAASTAPEPIRACLLVGGWDGDNAADQEVLELLAEKPYAELEATFQALATCRDPLLLHADRKWRIISKDEAWGTFGDRVPATILETFELIVIDVLTDDDPKYDLPADDRYLAPVTGHVPKYSSTIKKHIAETLAFLGSMGHSLEAASSVNIAATVDRIVERLLAPDATWQRWASLGQRLTMLAEASPQSFIRAVQADIARAEPVLVSLFVDTGNPLFSSCNHAGLLWALEGMAWSTQYLADVCQCLLKLHSLDPGGQWANRPRNSLCEILSYWLPYTTATVDQRIQILDLLLRKLPDAAWSLLLALLPNPGGGFSNPTHKPYWRDWASDWTEGATHYDIQKFLTAIAQRLLDHCHDDPRRLVQIVEHLRDFSPTLVPLVIAKLTAVAAAINDDQQRRQLADKLSTLIGRHKRARGAQWTFSDDVLDQLSTVLTALQPRTSALRHAWLFCRWPDQFYRGADDIDVAEKRLALARSDAIHEIITEQGFAGLEMLARQAECANTVGLNVALATEDRFLDEMFPLHLSKEAVLQNMVGGFIWIRFRAEGWQWVDRLFGRCTTDEGRAWFLSVLPFVPETWQRALAAGAAVSDSYWGRCSPWNPELETEHVEHAVAQLLGHQRVMPAINMLSMALHQKKDIGTTTLCSTLESLLTAPAANVSTNSMQDAAHSIGDILQALQERVNADETQLLKLEWFFLKVLDSHFQRSPRTLHRYLAAHPEFFVEALSCCFRSEKADEEAAPVTDQDQFTAKRAYELLDGWEVLPGTDPAGYVDEQQLRSWCTEARRLAEQVGRLNVCDSQIGQLFAHAPSDADGSWPCAPVRRVAEEIATEQLASGWHCGICNGRGVVWRRPGGNQERELAARYRGLADQIRFEAPFVASVLDGMVQSYQNEARSWDEVSRWEGD